MENVICIIFMNNLCDYKIIKFKTREVAKDYYRVALHKPNFRFAGTLKECIKWCTKNKYEYTIIERDKYNVYE